MRAFLCEKHIKEIITSRLTLKPLTKEDDENLFALHADPEVMKYIRPSEEDIFQTKKKIKTILDYTKSNPKFGLWTAYLGDEFIGWIILLHIEHNQDYPIEVGYRLHTKHWGQGFATEMTKSILKYAKEINLKSVCAITTEENIGSQKVLKKAGLKYIEDRLYYETPVQFYELEL